MYGGTGLGGVGGMNTFNQQQAQYQQAFFQQQVSERSGGEGVEEDENTSHY